jgi:uncharacterized protein
MNLKKKIFLFLLFLFSIQLSAQNQTEIPELKRPVMDLVGILKPEEVSIIENKILNLQKEKGSQIAVLIIPSTGDLPIEDYSIRVAEKWKLGRKGVDDGVLFLIAYNDRKMRIEVGYGLEGAIPDAKAKQILDDFVRPHFKNKNFYKGIDTGVDLLIKLIKNEPLPEPQQDQVTPFIVGLIFMFVPLIFHFHCNIFNFYKFTYIGCNNSDFRLSLDYNSFELYSHLAFSFFECISHLVFDKSYFNHFSFSKKGQLSNHTRHKMVI